MEEGKPITMMEEEQQVQDRSEAHPHFSSYYSSSSCHLPSFTNTSQQNQTNSSSSLAQYLSNHFHTTSDYYDAQNSKNIMRLPPPKERTSSTTKLRTKFTIGASDDEDVHMHMDEIEQPNPHQHHNRHPNESNHQYISYSDYNHQNHNIPSYLNNDHHYHPEILEERMEIEDILPKPPLIVLDGANIAYAYVQTFQSTPSLSSSSSSFGGKRHHHSHSPPLEPNALGIKLAVEYFLHAGCRVQVVIPAYWIRNRQHHSKNLTTSSSSSHQQHLQILNQLQEQNILCCSPPTDDDDAYCIAIARREDGRSRLRRKGRHVTSTTTTSTIYHTPEVNGSAMNAPSQSSLANQEHGLLNTSSSFTDLTIMDGGFIVSNDLYRDAIYRDSTHDLKRWLDGPSSVASLSIKKANHSKDDDHRHWKNHVDDIPRRISYSFADLGSIDTYGDAILDFVPNPRHALISMIDGEMRKQYYSHESF